MTYEPATTPLAHGFFDLERRLSSQIGFRLFTVLLVDLPDVVRVHSSNPDDYPLTGRKKMGPTPWGAHVITEGKAWLGQTPDDLKWAFPDHALIASLGCGCCINIPVRDGGQTIGALNLLDIEGRYQANHLRQATEYAELSVPLLRAAANQA
jgi:hypothetical protein